MLRAAILLKKIQMHTVSNKVTRIYLFLLFSASPYFLFFFLLFFSPNRLGVQPRICEPRYDQRPPAPTSEWCSDPHVWTSSHDPVCVHSQPGQTGLCQGHEVLLLMKADTSVILWGRKEKQLTGNKTKLEMADAQCWEATFTLEILHFYLNLWQVRHLSLTMLTVLYVT